MTPRPRSPVVFGGDFWRACARLEIVDPATAAAVRSLLSGADGRPASVDPRSQTTRPEAAVILGPDVPGSTGDAARGNVHGESDPSHWRTVEGSAEHAVPMPAWLGPGDGRESEAPAPGWTGAATADGPTARAGPWAPLLPAARMRAVLGAATAARVPEGEVDVPAVVAAIGRGSALRTLPRQPVWTHRLGVQLLLDTAPAMQPWLLDLAGLARQLTAVAGPRVETLRFAACPLRGAGPGLRPWNHYRPPPPGTPVLVVTDLGGGGPWAPRPAPADEWARFVQVVRSAGCRPVALVPGPAGRADLELAMLLPILPWDWSTTVRLARRVRR